MDQIAERVRRHSPFSRTPMTPQISSCIPPNFIIAEYIDPSTRERMTFRLAENSRDLKLARELVYQMYARKGYPTDRILPENPRYWTLLLTNTLGTPIGTISVGSGHEGLRAEESYPEEIQAIKENVGSPCEFNALATLPFALSPFSFARLFHLAMLLGNKILGYSSGVIEVTRSHARFYERILGFVTAGKGRQCTRVGVQSVLLTLNLCDSLQRAKAFGGMLQRPPKDHTYYPLMFGQNETETLLKNFFKRVIVPEPQLINRYNEFVQTFQVEEPSVLSQSEHLPSVLA